MTVLKRDGTQKSVEIIKQNGNFLSNITGVSAFIEFESNKRYLKSYQTIVKYTQRL